MAEKTASEQIEELNKEINEKSEELKSLPLGIEGSGVFLQELAAFMTCNAELDVLIEKRDRLRAKMRRTRD